MYSEKEKIRKAKYYQQHKKEKQEYARQYRLNNPEKFKEIKRKSELKHPETRIKYNQKYYQNYKNKLLADNKEYRQTHKKELNLKKQEWTKNNPNLRAKYSREYQSKNPKALLNRQIKYLTKIGKVHDMDYYETKLALLSWSRIIKKRDQYKCVRCDSVHKLEAHHIKPKQTHHILAFDLDNGETLCGNCHYKIHGKREGVKIISN